MSLCSLCEGRSPILSLSLESLKQAATNLHSKPLKFNFKLAMSAMLINKPLRHVDSTFTLATTLYIKCTVTRMKKGDVICGAEMVWCAFPYSSVASIKS